MIKSPLLEVYQASAGSGKTFQLALRYLIICFSSKNSKQFSRVLAITFTNKAAIEMKERVLETLEAIANKKESGTSLELFRQLQTKLSLSEVELRVKARNILSEILHDYSRFSMQTIDSFTQRIVQGFSMDLGLPLNFETQLDPTSLLELTAARVLEKQDSTVELQEALQLYAKSKFEKGSSFDAQKELESIGKGLLLESKRELISRLKKIDRLALFQNFKEQQTYVHQFLKDYRAQVNAIIKKIDEAGLSTQDFNGKSNGAYTKLQKEKERLEVKEIVFTPTFIKNAEASKILNPDNIKNQPELNQSLSLDIQAFLNFVDQHVAEVLFRQCMVENYFRLSLLSDMAKALEEIYAEQRMLHISEFNKLIAEALKDQPAAFIFERIGERFQQFFIDEFQDTSRQQWQNITPLVENAMASGGKTMLVGDAKQGIYRWRSGSSEQFLEIIEQKESYPMKERSHEVHLIHEEKGFKNTNYRSSKTIVDFNNKLYESALSSLNKTMYQELYKGAAQVAFNQQEGYVKVSSFPSGKNTEPVKQRANEWILEQIETCLSWGYQAGDISILVRSKNEGIRYAEYLNKQGFKVVSADSLRLLADAETLKIINVLKWVSKSKDATTVLAVYQDLIADEKLQFDKMAYRNLDGELDRLVQSVYPLNHWRKMSVLPLMESIIEKMGLEVNEKPFILDLLNEALVQAKNGLDDISGFLDHLERKNPSVELSATKDAIQILTIHKSKGLEFEIVLLPLLGAPIIDGAKAVFNIRLEDKWNCPEIEISKKVLEKLEGLFPEQVERQINEHYFDALNLLYVATTRAKSGLFILTKQKSKKASSDYIDDWINSFVNIEADEESSFGSAIKPKPIEKEETINETLDFQFEKESWDQKLRIAKTYLEEFQMKSEVAFGNLLHLAMEKICSEKDIARVLNSLEQQGKLKAVDKGSFGSQLKRIVNHPELENYFKNAIRSKAEWTLLSENGELQRPDLVLEMEKEIVVLDYKTGKEEKGHASQLLAYISAISKISDKSIQGKLVYVSDNEVNCLSYGN